VAASALARKFLGNQKESESASFFKKIVLLKIPTKKLTLENQRLKQIIKK